MRISPLRVTKLLSRRGLVAASLFLGCLAPAFGAGGAPSTTTLAVTSSGSAVTTVAAGSVVTLTATVTSGGAPVSPGQVKFCDASATYCEDSHLLGVAQLTSGGIATLSFVPGIGSHSYRAVFLGTTAIAGSTSPVATLSVTGLYPTATTIAESGTIGDYSLTATVTGSGTHALSPTGSVSFLDTNNANSALGTAPLGLATSGFSFDSGPAVPVNATSAILADFNGDGYLDIAAVTAGGSSSQNNTVNVLLGKGDGTYVQSASLASTAPVNFSGVYFVGVLSADFNGDGKLDLVTLPFHVFLGKGDGTFTAVPNAAVDGLGSSAVVGDFNGDGIEDIALLSYATITILLGNGDGTFTQGTPISLPNGDTANGLFAADINGDGKLDLVASCDVDNQAAGCDSGNQAFAYVLLGNGDGTFNANLIGGPDWTANGVGAVADFNGDGKPDLLITGATVIYPSDNANLNTAPSQILLGNGDGTFGNPFNTPVSYPVGAYARNVPVDLNGDGALDLVEYSSYYPGAVVVYFGNGDGSFRASPTGLTPQNYLDQGFAVGDLNGDGLPDILVLQEFTPAEGVIEYSHLTEVATASVSGISAPVLGLSNLVEASYPGDTNFAASLSGTVSLAASAPTTLTLTATPAGSTAAGQPITLTATLSPYAAQGFNTNGEKVTFTLGGTTLGSGTLAGGVATLQITPATVGSVDYAAAYAGDANFGPASGNLAYTVTAAPTTLVLEASPLGSTFGQSVTLTATLSPASVSTTSSNGEQVTFFTGTTSLGTGTLTNGLATLATTALPAGVDSLTAQYAGDGTLAPSTSAPVADTVLAIPSITFAVANKTYGVAPFTVAATSTSTGAITYSVVSGPAAIAGATVTVTGAGTVVLQASQAATSADIAATQNASFVVAPASLAISANSVARVFGAANPAFTGTVTGAVNGDTFTETFSTTATMASSVGSYPITPSVTGTNLADYAVSVTPGTLTVSQAGSSTTLALTNGNKTFTATVTSLTSGDPTGTVTFYEGQTAVGTGTVSGGVATYTASSFPVGDVVVSAEYSGDANFTESQSPPILLLGLALGLDSLTVGQSGSVTDTVTVSVVPGYTGTVTFSCAGLPANASCSFAPASVTFSGASTSAQATVTISTGVSGQARVEGLGDSAGVWAAGLLGPGLLGLAMAGRRKRLRAGLIVLVLCGLGLGLTACGGGKPLTPEGQTTVQVVATGPEGLSQTSSVTLMVQ